ncbi:molybdenum cofactor biosynthesis protein MoaE [Galbitalea soli]|uniref:Molybdenum cofactor biosynthesis protein MoaE n=1 Tax=Galbitalea soli TaxID=1268042 RepID=A0A7C9PMH8_9MICO|nr:molybdenum cofactor biosynthesis protein MoaE [Galbitalea soli]NEM90748.1 molybdenum cofactor biosynthesis protein MoaE [Galbitalea soli]NYJ31466.1 molybdopterin synthase catalytic subunit [Galbitalea soli]
MPEHPSASRVVFATVVDTPIAVRDCADAVANAAAGAVVTFEGVVRDHDGGRGVLALDYEGHPQAGEVIASVAAAVAEQFPGVTIAVSHRVGALVIGDVALAAAVSSAHRAEAFAACGRLVDAVKESVPIWKEQRFTDGTSEWVGSLG